MSLLNVESNAPLSSVSNVVVEEGENSFISYVLSEAYFPSSALPQNLLEFILGMYLFTFILLGNLRILIKIFKVSLKFFFFLSICLGLCLSRWRP